MSSSRNRLIIAGFGDWGKAPVELAYAADPIVRAHAERARDQILAAYPEKTGELEAKVDVIAAGRLQQGRSQHVVVSKAYYAHIYEFGSKHQRPRPTFLPITNRERHACTAEIVAMVQARGGLKVTGSDG